MKMHYWVHCIVLCTFVHLSNFFWFGLSIILSLKKENLSDETCQSASKALKLQDSIGSNCLLLSHGMFIKEQNLVVKCCE